ncbi:unnamed protein product [Prorocentrum cordatum]|uniref:GB1/RHD3-type G domain-containing protein n=1 Tax=Prorocentrum cordatum TaxID=2364126 RepID=A0ABN9XYE6_9DINO|nr:unnamed protein product [Polarella glacialis]
MPRCRPWRSPPRWPNIFRQHDDLVDGQRLAPAFLWVLRDFALALEDLAGNKITAQQYMEGILTPGGAAVDAAAPPGVDGASWQGHREARATIRELFPERDCATLCLPVEDEEQLQVLGQMKLDEMRPKFARQVGELRSRVLQGCPVLRAPGGEMATGGAWIALLQSHVEAMNAGGVPKLGSAWQHVSEQECARALEEAMRAFSAATLGLAASFPTGEEELDLVFQHGRASAMQRFAEVALGDGRAREDFLADLERELQESASRLRRENRDAALRANEAWLRQRLERDFEGKFRDYQHRFDTGTLTVEACKEAETVLTGKLKLLRAAYMEEAVGPEEAIVEAVERLLVQRQEALRRELAAWHRAASRKGRQGAGGAAAPGDVHLREKGGRRGRGPGAGEPGEQPKCCAVQ